MHYTTLLWAGTLALIAGLFILDLAVEARKPHVPAFKESVAWSLFYIAVALAFGAWLASYAGAEYGAEYFAGYIVEKSLSIDNLFVFLIIMTTFAVPPKFQHKLLTLGIFGALVLRAVFIFLGAAMLANFSFMYLVFGAVLVVTGVKLFQHRDQDPEINDNALVRVVRRTWAMTDGYREGHYFVREDGARKVTPLFVALIALLSTDLLFALDSIPAVYGVTDEPYIVFAANAFALLGLRALFFLVKGLLDRLVYLSTGLSAILVFIGAKLVLHWAHLIWHGVPQVSTAFSLGFICVVLGIAAVASIIKTRRDPAAVAHAGSIRDHSDHDDTSAAH